MISDSINGGDCVDAVRMARSSIKFSFTDQPFASPSCFIADSIAGASQAVVSSVVRSSAAKSSVSSRERFFGRKTSGDGMTLSAKKKPVMSPNWASVSTRFWISDATSRR